MKEIEVLVKFDNTKEEILKILSKFKYEGEKVIHDIYYIDELRENLKPEEDLRMSEQFRVRKSDDECMITYKKVHFNGKRWTYTEEYETKVEDFDTINKIIKFLGLKELIVVKNKRKVYTYNNYEILFEEVEGLGYFLEVERLVDDNVKNIDEIKEDIKKLIRGLNLKNTVEVNMGKNQMMYKKSLQEDQTKDGVDFSFFEL